MTSCTAHTLGACDICLCVHFKRPRPRILKSPQVDAEAPASSNPSVGTGHPMPGIPRGRVVVIRMPCRGRLALECERLGCPGHMRRIIVVPRSQFHPIRPTLKPKRLPLQSVRPREFFPSPPTPERLAQ